MGKRLGHIDLNRSGAGERNPIKLNEGMRPAGLIPSFICAAQSSESSAADSLSRRPRQGIPRALRYKSSSQNSPLFLSASLFVSRTRSSTLLIFPEIVFGRSQNSSRRMRLNADTRAFT
jgi:hypothetical protein